VRLCKVKAGRAALASENVEERLASMSATMSATMSGRSLKELSSCIMGLK
jgi:hypothetical protein